MRMYGAPIRESSLVSKHTTSGTGTYLGLFGQILHQGHLTPHIVCITLLPASRISNCRHPNDVVLSMGACNDSHLHNVVEATVKAPYDGAVIGRDSSHSGPFEHSHGLQKDFKLVVRNPIDMFPVRLTMTIITTTLDGLSIIVADWQILVCALLVHGFFV
jgi:hypothetical protein